MAKDIQQLERVQRRAARFVKKDYRHTTSVTGLFDELGWLPLFERHKQSRLTVFGRPLGQAIATGNPSVCNVGVLWPNGLSDRDDFWHTPCPGQQ